MAKFPPTAPEAFTLTMDQHYNQLVSRKAAWALASELVTPIIESYGLDDIRSGPAFGPITTFSKADQHIDHTIRVANWLLGED